MRTFSWKVVTAVLGVGLLAAACGSSSASSTATTTAAAATSTKANKGPFVIDLSNNYIGNDWRIQMEKEATVAASMAPFKGVVKLRVVNAANTVPAQIASLDAIVASKPNAILIDAGSPTALNPVIQQACAAGIVVVNFDQTVSAPCAYKISTNFQQGEVASAEWMAKMLHGKGNLFEDTGLAGVPISQAITNAWSSVLSKYPGLHIVGSYQGKYALGPEQSGVASLLAAHPNVNGILTQGYCTGAIKALQQAGHPLVPMVCQAYNQTFVALAQDSGASGFIMANPAWLSVLAMKTAVAVLQGQKVSKTTVLTPPCFYKGGTSPAGISCTPIQVGVNAFPKLSGNLTLPPSPSFMKITAAQVVP